MANDKNFSEPKRSNSIKRCLACEENVPKLALNLPNHVAIETGQFCCWICMLSKLGREKAYVMLDKKVKELKDKRR